MSLIIQSSCPKATESGLQPEVQQVAVHASTWQENTASFIFDSYRQNTDFRNVLILYTVVEPVVVGFSTIAAIGVC